MRPIQHAFTLIELMVVMVITLIIMGMLTSIFVSTTKIVTSVELKLRLQEQARGILDSIEQQIIQASANERGGQFSIKGITYTDKDPDLKVSSNLSATASIRRVDLLTYAQVGRTSAAIISPMLQPSNEYGSKEYALNSYISKIHYPWVLNNGLTGEPTISNQAISTDVSQLTFGLYKVEMIQMPWNYKHLGPTNGGMDYRRSIDTDSHPLEPGHEYLGSNSPGPWQATRAYSAGFGTNVMDVAFAVWDETDRKFHTVPHLHAVYFAPIPKAVLVSITVSDIFKKGRISFSRVVRMPCGTGNGHFDATLANADTGTAAKTLAALIATKNPAEASTATSDDKNSNHTLDYAETVTSLFSLPQPYNRLKLLRTNTNTAGPDDYDPRVFDPTYFK